MGNVRKHRHIKLVTTDEKRNKLVSDSNYHSTKRFSENLLAIGMEKTKVKMNKPLYLSMSKLGTTKTLMYKFWYDYIKPKYGLEQNYYIRILIALLFVLYLKIFLNTLILMFKCGLIHLTIMKTIKDLFQ